MDNFEIIKKFCNELKEENLELQDVVNDLSEKLEALIEILVIQNIVDENQIDEIELAIHLQKN